MDDLMTMLLEAQRNRRMTAGKWIASIIAGLIASLLVILFSAAQGVGLLVGFGIFGAVVFGITLIVSVIMHFCGNGLD